MNDAQIDLSRSERAICLFQVENNWRIELQISKNIKKLIEIIMAKKNQSENKNMKHLKFKLLNQLTQQLQLMISLLFYKLYKNLHCHKNLTTHQIKLDLVSNQDHKWPPFLKALIISASNQTFQIKELFLKLNAIFNSINTEMLFETNAVKEYEERLAQLDVEFTEFQRQINAFEVDLIATNSRSNINTISVDQIDKIDQITVFFTQPNSR